MTAFLIILCAVAWAIALAEWRQVRRLKKRIENRQDV